MSRIGILWDVDGTLMDTAEQHFRAWERFAAQLGRPYTRANFARTFGWRNPEILRTLFDPDASDEQCAEWGDRKETLYKTMVRAEGVELLPGVWPLLEAFAERGWPQAVGSSAPRGNLDLLLGAATIEPFFAAIVSGDDVQRGKPDPEVFVSGAKGIGVEPGRCVVFEDAPAGVQAAKAGGMACVAVTFVGHHPAESLRLAGADLIVRTLAEVTAEQVVGLVGA